MIGVLQLLGKFSLLALMGIVLGFYGLYALAIKSKGRYDYE